MIGAKVFFTGIVLCVAAMIVVAMFRETNNTGLQAVTVCCFISGVAAMIFGSLGVIWGL